MISNNDTKDAIKKAMKTALCRRAWWFLSLALSPAHLLTSVYQLIQKSLLPLIHLSASGQVSGSTLWIMRAADNACWVAKNKKTKTQMRQERGRSLTAWPGPLSGLTSVGTDPSSTRIRTAVLHLSPRKTSIYLPSAPVMNGTATWRMN